MQEVAIPNLVDSLTNEFGGDTFSGVVRCVVLDKDGMFSLPGLAYTCSSIVWDGRKCRWAWGYHKGGPPGCGCSLDEPDKIVDAIPVVWYVKEWVGRWWVRWQKDPYAWVVKHP